MADVGALEPRHPPPPHPLGGDERRARRGGRAAAHAARHAVPVPGRGARAGGCRRTRASGASTRAGGTAAAPRSRGTPIRATAGRRTSRGCRGRPRPARRSVESQRNDPGSMLHLYRALLTERRTSPALRQGEIRVVPSPEEVLAYERRAGDDLRRVLVSFADRELDVPLEQAGRRPYEAPARRHGTAACDRTRRSCCVPVS